MSFVNTMFARTQLHMCSMETDERSSCQNVKDEKRRYKEDDDVKITK